MFMNTETSNLKSFHLLARNIKLADRLDSFKSMMSALQLTYKRTVLSAADREVTIKDPFTGILRDMLMFASNNYLGLATHPHVKKRVVDATDEFGCGIGGPPLLNGYIRLIEELEERLAAFKSQQAAIVFSSGFLANLGVVSALAEHNDIILYDELSHASFYDGIRLTKARAIPFVHNDIDQLTNLAEEYGSKSIGTVFVCIEGVYSMDGDIAPLDKISRICKSAGAILIVDDAHGTGILGEKELVLPLIFIVRTLLILLWVHSAKCLPPVVDFLQALLTLLNTYDIKHGPIFFQPLFLHLLPLPY